MRTLTYYVATSLDGRVAGPDGDFGMFPVEGDHMPVLLRDFADTIPGHVAGSLGVEADRSRFDTVVMGRRTYLPALEAGIASPYPHLRQVVATRHGGDLPDAIETTDDPVAMVRALKQEAGSGIWLAGGGELAGALIDEIDHLILKVNPLVLGDGIPLFGGLAHGVRRFARTGVRAFDSGVVIAEHARVRD